MNILSKLFVSIIALAASFSVNAGGYVYARVISVEPVYRTVYDLNRQNDYACNSYYDEREYDTRGRDAVIGMAIGGAVGRQFGDGSGRDAATIAGALLGGSIGYDRGRDNRRYDRRHYRDCYRTRNSSRHYRDGYYVTYTIDGYDRQTIRMQYDPGDRVRVRVRGY
jgi:uncharacterized protein YcfJ